MAITDWPLSERPREKLLTQGCGTLSDAELLAIFLRTGCMGKSAVDLARDLLVQFNGLRPLLESDKQTFCLARGLGEAKYAQLQAVLEMGVKRFLMSQLRHQEREVFAVLFLDNQHALIEYEELFKGSINTAYVHPREIAKCALSYNAAAVILAHNHPSGVADPSESDRLITCDISKALNLLDIKVLDHMVVGDTEVTSFAELGLI